MTVRRRGMLHKVNLCLACGFQLSEPAWQDGAGSQEICPSCGLQFGYHDTCGGRGDLREGFYVGWRVRWIKEGQPWSGPKMQRPAGWSPASQLRRIDWPPASS